MANLYLQLYAETEDLQQGFFLSCGIQFIQNQGCKILVKMCKEIVSEIQDFENVRVRDALWTTQ